MCVCICTYAYARGMQALNKHFPLFIHHHLHFLSQVWLYAVHRLYIDHIANPLLPDSRTLDLSG